MCLKAHFAPHASDTKQNKLIKVNDICEIEGLNKASPKAISGRTSYYQAWLAFHSLPQLIPEYCTTHGFGPLVAFQQPSPWPWQARLASGPRPTFCPPKFLQSKKFGGLRAFNTWFPYAYTPEAFRQKIKRDSLARSTKSTPSPRKTRLRLFVSKWFQVLFHRGHPPAFHLSLTVLIHYR